MEDAKNQLPPRTNKFINVQSRVDSGFSPRKLPTDTTATGQAKLKTTQSTHFSKTTKLQGSLPTTPSSKVQGQRPVSKVSATNSPMDVRTPKCKSSQWSFKEVCVPTASGSSTGFGTCTVKLHQDLSDKHKRDISELTRELEFVKSRLQDSEIETAKVKSEVSEANKLVKRSKEELAELHQKYSKKFRGSISNFESRLETSNTEHEKNLDNLELKLEADIASLKKTMAEREEINRKTIIAKTADISMLLGRLEESRSAREALIRDTRRYDAEVQELQAGYSRALQEINSLKAEKESQIGFREEVSQIVEMNSNEKCHLETLVLSLKDEKEELIRKSHDLNEIVTKMEEHVKIVEAKNAELETKILATEKYIRDCRESKVVEFSDELQNQISVSTSYIAQLKSQLKTHEEKVIELERLIMLKDVELKVALGVKEEAETRKFKLEATNSSLLLKVSDYRCQVEEKEKIIQQHKDKYANLESNLAKVQRRTRIECGVSNQKQVRELKSKISELEAELLVVSGERRIQEEELRSFREKEKLYLKTSDELKISEKNIEKLERKLSQQKMAISTIKEACVVLEEQLVEFEKAYNGKCNELQTVEMKLKEKKDLIVSLQSDIQKSMNNLQVTVSVKEALRSQLHQTQNLLEHEKEDKSRQFLHYEQTVSMLAQDKKELTEALQEAIKGIEKTETSKDSLSEKMKLLSNYNVKLQIESSSRLTEVIELNDEKRRWISERASLVEQCQRQQTALENSSEEYCFLLSETVKQKSESETTIKNQAALISQLQKEIEMLSQKRKTFAEKIFGRDPGKSTPAKKIQNHLAEVYTQSSNISESNPIDKCEKLDVEIYRPSKEEMEMQKRLPEFGLTLNPIYCEEADPVYINCIKRISGDMFLLGCEEGLFSIQTELKENCGQKVKINGIGPVNEIKLVPKINYAIICEGTDRKLCLIPLEKLLAAAEKKSTLHKAKAGIKGVENCTIFDIGCNPTKEVILVAVMSNSLNVFLWDENNFNLRFFVRTGSPITCTCLTRDSIIYGADVVYEMDLKTYQINEFLDESEASLHRIGTTTKYESSYTVAIVDVTGNEEDSLKEYLICYSDMGLFVDEFGKRSRDEIISWAGLPISIAYKQPDLFVFHFEGVEIQTLTASNYKKNLGSCQKKSESNTVTLGSKCFFPLSQARLLGVEKPLSEVPIATALFLGISSSNKTEVLEIKKGVEKKESNVKKFPADA